MPDISKINQELRIKIKDRFVENGTNRYFYVSNRFLKNDSKKVYYIENLSESVICNKDD